MECLILLCFVGFLGWYSRPELNGDSRFRKPLLALRDGRLNMHDQPVTTTRSNDFKASVDVS
jgi:hypothetical protein